MSLSLSARKGCVGIVFLLISIVLAFRWLVGVIAGIVKGLVFFGVVLLVLFIAVAVVVLYIKMSSPREAAPSSVALSPTPGPTEDSSEKPATG